MDKAQAARLAAAALQNSEELRASAESVFRDGNVGHAFGLLTLAAEELAKAWMYSELVKGRAVIGKPPDRRVRSIRVSDFSSHSAKDEIFAELVITSILFPLIMRRYWVTLGPASPVFEGFDPGEFESFVQYYMEMDPGVAAALLDRSGKSEKRMDVLTHLCVRIGEAKNDAFYVGARDGTLAEPRQIEPREYLGLRETYDWMLRTHGETIRSAKPTDGEVPFVERLRKAIAEGFGEEFLKER